MKEVFKISLFLSWTLILLFLSCKKEFSCEDCFPSTDSLINKPPVAIAGNDQNIDLPKDSCLLNGIGSFDPDGNNIIYQWTQLSGPATATILNRNTEQTGVTGLVQGIYLFELTVTDSLGLFARDTVQIMVNASTAIMRCDNSIRTEIPAQLIPFGSLSKGKISVTVASAGNKIVFAGGESSIDCIDLWCDQWGSSRVDIYDVSSQKWSIAELSTPRFGIAAIAAGNKIFFAGGESGDGAFNVVYSNIDIYDVATNTWTVDKLSVARSYIGAAIVGNKVFFAGGEINDYQTSNVIDIYDLSTNTWSTAQLGVARANISAVTLNNKIYFGGGWITNYWDYIPSDAVDIYNNDNGSWSNASLGDAMGGIAGIAVDQIIYYVADCIVKIITPNGWTITETYLSQPGWWSTDDGFNVVLKNNKLIFLRRNNEMPTNKFDIYDITTNTWSIGVLPQNNLFYSSTISVNNVIYVIGGMETNSFIRAKQVWKLEF